LFFMPLPPLVFLVDNGSLRPAATFSLRRVAGALSGRLEIPVRPVSLLHSSGIAVGELDGQPAELLEPTLSRALRAGARSIVILPLFFGPSAALTEYIPERVGALLRDFPGAEIRLAHPLVRLDGPGLLDLRLARALAARVEACWQERGWSRTQVVLVDHGTPQPAVGAVRAHLGRQLAELLADSAAGVHVASMERRAGDAYAFNEPLLEDRLRLLPCDQGRVVVAQQFLSPGRHAGPGGDLAAICAAAEVASRGLETALTEPLGDHPLVIDVLADRFQEAAFQTPLRAAS
jgi:sirohydrochlorin ferrochelatase